MSVTFDFAGRTVLVSGAAAGIGLALAQAFGAAGAQVGIVDVNPDALDDVRDGPLAGAIALPCDVSDSSAVNAAVAELHGQTGRLDVIINNAGILRDAMVWKIDDQMWAQVLAVHLTGTFNLTRAAVPLMRQAGYGRIVNVTSYAGLHGNTGQSNYSAAKAGIIGLTKATAKELARYGITVNAISPNAMTQMIASIPDERLAQIEQLIPMGRFAEPDEMAPAVCFLASEQAGYITGAVLPVDGGIAI